MKTQYCSTEELQDLRSLSQRMIQTDLQVLDIKQMAEFEHFYRGRCLLAISLYKSWLKEYREETDSLQILYGSIEGTLLRKQAEDAVKLYWIIRQDFRIALKEYIAKATQQAAYRNAA